MSLNLNPTVADLPVSVSMTFHTNARKMKEADPDILDLSAGEPDFDTPAPILEAGIRALRNGMTHYSTAQGMPELREAVSDKLLSENGCRYAPEDIIITPGSKFALYLALRTVVNPGDRVVFPAPAYVSYGPMIQASGGIPVQADLCWEDGYRLSPGVLEKAASGGCRAIVLNYPNNPTGNVLTEKEADILRDFMLSHPDTFIISDEIYERLVYDGHHSVSPSSLPEIASHCVTVNGFSKSAAMTGWRVGYLAAPGEITRAALKLQQHSVISVAPFTQMAAMEALRRPEETETMRLSYERRRALFISALNTIPGVICRPPEGAFYTWVRFPGYSLSSAEMCEYLLKNAKTVGVPGYAYGTEEGCVRFCFARRDEELITVAERIRTALSRL